MFVVIAINGLGYYIKYVLRQNGYETHWFSGHFKDIANLQSLHDREQDSIKKRNYKVLLIGFYFGLVTFFIVVIMVLKAWALV
jgi:hypothetical protein